MQPVILVIESHMALRQALRLWLAACFPQCRVITARTGASGIRAVRAHAPRIVVIDVQLAGGNGLEAVRRIKGGAPDINIIVFTLYDAEAYRAAAIHAGACAYVLKPRAGDLRPLLRRLLEGAPALRQTKTVTPQLFTNKPEKKQET